MSVHTCLSWLAAKALILSVIALLVMLLVGVCTGVASDLRRLGRDRCSLPTGSVTVAQLESENARLRQENESFRRAALQGLAAGHVAAIYTEGDRFTVIWP